MCKKMYKKNKCVRCAAHVQSTVSEMMRIHELNLYMRFYVTAYISCATDT